jgi:hypothetical protein
VKVAVAFPRDDRLELWNLSNKLLKKLLRQVAKFWHRKAAILVGELRPSAVTDPCSSAGVTHHDTVRITFSHGSNVNGTLE